MNAHCCWALVGLFVAVNTEAQEKKTAPSTTAEVRMNDGSVVRTTLLQESLEVQTKFGKLTIPFQEIRRIEFGLHVPAGTHEQVDAAIRSLGSDVYKEREEAAKKLIQAGHFAYIPLQKATKSNDMEVAQRANVVLKKITEKVAPEILRQRPEDVIHTSEFPVVGKIVSPIIKVHSAHFGELSLRLADLRNMHLRSQSDDNELMVDAAQYGSAPDQWLDSGITIDSTRRLIIKGEGQVDLWPQGPGQYVTRPKGYSTLGRGGAYQAGALIGKIGKEGKTFLIGESYEGVPATEGTLYLHIVPSPWNNGSMGSYNVRVQTQYVVLSR